MNNNSPNLRYRIHLKIKENLMDPKPNSQQAPVHWPREITKAKLNQAKSSFIHIFVFNDKRGRKGNLGNYGQLWAILDKFGQVGKSLYKETN